MEVLNLQNSGENVQLCKYKCNLNENKQTNKQTLSAVVGPLREGFTNFFMAFDLDNNCAVAV